MAAYIFKTIAQRASRAQIQPNTAKSVEWFRGMAQNVSVSPQQMLSSKENDYVKRIDNSMIGSLVFYFYSPKGKDTLPYYDRFPLVFITDIHPDGWSGINIHYLPPMLRAQIMDTLHNTAINKNNPENMRLKISYKILKSFANAPLFKVCFKRYLRTHLSSNIMRVKPTNWDMAAFLPTQRFAKKSAEQVWADSRKISNKKKARNGI